MGWGRGGGLLSPRKFEQSSGQVTLATHCPPHHYVAARQFAKENVLIERPGNEKEAPFTQERGP
jgi:hypothetical protein